MEEARSNDATHGVCFNHPLMVVNHPKRYNKKDGEVVCIGEKILFSPTHLMFFSFLYIQMISLHGFALVFLHKRKIKPFSASYTNERN